MLTPLKDLYYMWSPHEYYDDVGGLTFQFNVCEISIDILNAAIAHLEPLKNMPEAEGGLDKQGQLVLDIALRERQRLQEIHNEITQRLARARKGKK